MEALWCLGGLRREDSMYDEKTFLNVCMPFKDQDSIELND